LFMFDAAAVSLGNKPYLTVSKLSAGLVTFSKLFAERVLKVMPIILALVQFLSFSVSDQPLDTSTDFSDLGRKILGGFVLAVVVAITFTLVRLRWRDKNPPAKFISVVPSDGTEQPPHSE